MNNTDVVYEEHEDCLLPSTEEAADEMIVTDTTSTSNTIEVAAIPSAEMPTMEMPVTLETETAIEPEEPKEVAEIVTEPTPTISKTYHIIVASLPSLRGANETLDEYVAKGYTDASLVERDNRVRISIKQFTDKDEANSYLKSLREEDTFKNAWLLAVRN